MAKPKKVLSPQAPTTISSPDPQATVPPITPVEVPDHERTMTPEQVDHMMFAKMCKEMEQYYKKYNTSKTKFVAINLAYSRASMVCAMEAIKNLGKESKKK